MTYNTEDVKQILLTHLSKRLTGFASVDDLETVYKRIDKAAILVDFVDMILNELDLAEHIAVVPKD